MVRKSILDLVMSIFDNPELGYKEFKTSKTIIDYVNSLDSSIKIEKFLKTGIKFNLGEKKEKHIVLLAELDALYAPNHFNCDVNTKAAHCCGHYTQIGIMLEVLTLLLEQKKYLEYDYSIGFVFVPAEEYVDLDFRNEAIKNGEFTYLGGKPSAMKLGVFDEYDLCISIHSMGLNDKRNLIEINCDLAGFMYKYFSFKGKSSHAGFDPAKGVNAYSMSTLFNNALGLYRQQITDNLVRINPIVYSSNMSINIIPENITIGLDIRSHNLDTMAKISNDIDRMAKGVSYALGGDVEIKKDMGYLPFIQDRYLSSFAIKAFEKSSEIDDMIINNPVSAAGDIGDLSYMMPCIQIGYNGFKGVIHGNDFIHDNITYILKTFPIYLTRVLEEMDKKLEKDKMYKRSYETYEKAIQSL